MSIGAKKHKVVIVGGGLAGIYAAYKLTQLNIDFVLLEAKPQLGGRILATTNTPNETHDLGPTWIFEHQTKTQNLVHELGLSLFEQYSKGDALYQLTNATQAKRIQGAGTMRMCRVKGGTYRLIESLQAKINPSRIKYQAIVSDYIQTPEGWQLKTTNNELLNAEQLFIAIPPRIFARDIQASNEPSFMSPKCLDALNRSQTWMAAQAKFVASYPQAFWREQGLSGQSFSQVGPMVEMHDASLSEQDHPAIFGFIGVPALQRAKVSLKTLQDACLQQLAFFYGDIVYKYSSVNIKDWAADTLVCTAQDKHEPSRHPELDLTPFKEELNGLNLHFVGSEYSRVDPGYLEGALNAVDLAMSGVLGH